MAVKPQGHDDRRRWTIDRRVTTRLLDELPDAVIVLDLEGRLVWANRSAERLFGQSAGDWIGHSTLEFVHPEDLELVLRSLVSVQNKEIGTLIEVRLRGTGGWRLVELIGAPVEWLKEGAVLFSLRDITERRRFEVAHNEEARLRAVLQNAATVTILVSSEGIIESVSGALNRILGHDPEFVEGQLLADLVSEADRPTFLAALERASQGSSTASPVTVTVRLLRFGGNGVVPFELVFINLIEDPTVGGFVVSAHDVTNQVAAEFELRKTLALLTATLDSSSDGILVVDTTGRMTTFNRRLADMWQLPDSILRNRDIAAANAFVLGQLVRPEVFLARIRELSADPEAEGKDILELKDGRVFERHVTPQRVDDDVIGRVFSFRDVTERKRFEEDLSYQAFHDSLTGLANKALFLERLQLAADRIQRNHGHLAILFLDLDDFKTVNDSLGHSAGDVLLKTTAEVLVGCLRNVDSAARFGGDEFAVLIEDVEQTGDVLTLARRILAAFRTPLNIGSHEVSVTVSIGIAFDASGLVGDEILRNADLAMYAAKERGKDRYAEFEDEMRTASGSQGRRSPAQNLTSRLARRAGT
jgi:diguanylate cyclase (GGDEF)-like protein/PAS domain S-box-containing protein